jgi:hypothetical protein
MTTPIRAAESPEFAGFRLSVPRRTAIQGNAARRILMNHLKGIVAAIKRCGSHYAVSVMGPAPGTFILDNCCLAGIIAVEGPDWIGRPVEYEDGFLRFLDHEDDATPARRTSPKPARSTHSR